MAGAYFHKDLVFITTPLENLYSRLQHTGQSPLWAPELAGGYPLLANGQLGFWYPPHVLLREFLPSVWVLNISLLLHALLGGLGMYYWLKHNRLSPAALITGAILFPLGATMVGKYESLNLILPFMWVPLLLGLLQLFLETGRTKYFFWWMGANILSILVGHPQLAIYILILDGIFVGCLVGSQWSRWRRALITAGGVLLMIGLTSFYWLPILDVVPETDRAHGTLKPNEQGMFDYQFTPVAFKGLVIPHPFGHHETYTGPTSENELSSYYGPLALVLGVVGLMASRRRFSLWGPAVVFGVIGLALAIGGYSPLFRWLVRHGWTYFNFPARFFFYTHVGLVVLIAAGVAVSTRYVKQPVLQGLLVSGIILPALWVSWGWHDGVPWPLTKEPVLAQLLQKEPGPVRVLAGTQLAGIKADEDFGIKKWNPLCANCRYRQTFTSPVERLDGLAIKVAKLSDSNGLITLRLYTPDGQLLREVRQSNHDMMDNDWTEFKFTPLPNILNQAFYFELTSDMATPVAPRLLIHLNPHQQYDPTGQVLNCTSGTCTPVREADLAFKSIMTTPAVVYYDALAPYVAAGFGLGSTQWAGSLPILIVKEYLAPFDTWGDTFRDGARTMMNRFGTNYLIGVFPPYRYLSSDGFSLVASVPYGDQVLRLYHNDEAWPRLQFATNVKAYVSTLDQVNLLLKTSSQDRQTVLADIPADKQFDVSNNQAHFIKDERTDIQIQTQQSAEGFLVLRDVWFKDWQATVDNQPVTVYRVDGIFRGIMVPAGEHTVRFAYKPAWIKPAVYIELVSLAIMILALAYTYISIPKLGKARYATIT